MRAPVGQPGVRHGRRTLAPRHSAPGLGRGHRSHDQRGDPVGPPPAQQLVDNECGQREEAGRRADPLKVPSPRKALLFIRLPRRRLAIASGVSSTSEIAAAAIGMTDAEG